MSFPGALECFVRVTRSTQAVLLGSAFLFILP